MSLDPVRRAILTDMAYELGGAGLAGFINFLAAVRTEAWLTATIQLKNSLLFKQVPTRENRNIAILLSGQFPPGVTCGEDLTKLNEGLTLIAKPDAKGKWEWGYGEDIPAPADGVPPTCTEDQADAMFAISYPLAAQRAEADLGSEYWGN